MIEYFLANNSFYKEIINSSDYNIKNGSTDYMISLAVTDFKENNKNIFIVLPNLYEAQKTYDKLTSILNEEYVLFFPGDELVAAEILNSSGDFKFERINTIVSLLKNDRKYIIVTNVNAAVKYELNKSLWQSSIFSLKKDLTFKRELLIEKLLSAGYKRTYTVTRTGEFSNRGEIIDIFPLNSLSPVRIDYFDDDIDSIKEFDIDTQKSIREINQIEIIPVSELFYSSQVLEASLNKIKEFKESLSITLDEDEKISQDLMNLENRDNVDNLMRYIKFFDSNAQSILDFVEDKKIYYVDMGSLKETYEHMTNDLASYCQSVNSFFVLKLDYYMSLDKFLSYPNIKSEGLIEYFSNGFNPCLETIDKFQGNPELIVTYLKENYNKSTIIISLNSELRLQRLKDILLENSITYQVVSGEFQIKKGFVNIVYGQSFVTLSLFSKKIIIINEETLFDSKYVARKAKYKSIYKNTTKVSSYNELKDGDYVVHFDYGIGIYKGLKTIDNNGIKRDYLEISYADGDTLYVPLEQISRIEKYNVGDDSQVKITKIRTGAWERAKERVRKKVHDISDKLIKLYATRSQSVGFACDRDNAMQMEFENNFFFELTPDQEKAISDVKRDMESSKVMDRLICGDVGYGKTEVALRAAFKAVMNSKQVALLCPTTILASQHYKNFKSRMEDFGVTIELVNRFVPMKKQKEIFKGLEQGNVDIVIGTHRLLSDQIKYHDLGLLIIDEEQRFGVMHKEKIRQIKVNVDTITLSATPIPRTLQMSIAGIKELSMITTPPKNRYPVQTYVLERNDAIIRDAVLREMARGGQVFYMYNFVDDIESIASHIQTLVPDARVGIGHGKMEKSELEDIISAFINKEYDVLVCTTIIETGIDIPDCNTLIIHDANRLGLSQLYQLRGRVGRSDRIAYAYMMYQPKMRLTDEAKKRLEAIKEFNELGSGYKIAMRDLAIRGAGDILGDEQSGFITSVGLETYLEILNEEIEKIKHPKLEDKNKKEEVPNVELVSRTIDNRYISNDDVKIEIHKKIDKLKTLDGLLELSEELHDRFGDYPDELKYYMYEKLYQNKLEENHIVRTIDTTNEMTLFFSREASQNIDGNKIFMLANETSKDIRLNYYDHQIQIIFNKRNLKNKNDYLIVLSTFLDKLAKK
ncbi:MAG: transcription-repair coupling factor [Acholeplasmatales bacterium]|nr:transcription-repair coupling factor [Acholeplasmatales bacterium]